MTTDLHDLLEEAAFVALPPPDGLDQALGRARRLRLRARLVQAAAVPLAVLALLALLHGGVDSAQVRTVPPAGSSEEEATTTTVDPARGDAVAEPLSRLRAGKGVPDTTLPLPAGSPVPTTLPRLFMDPHYTSPPVFDHAPPPGPRLAFDSGGEVWTMRFDGSDRQRLLKQGLSHALAWAPDDRTLLVSSPYDGKVGVDALDTQTGRVTPIVHPTDGDADGADFSPDGRHVVYSVLDDDWVYHLWIADADGSHARELPVHGGHPVWSPDGSRIAFTDCDANASPTDSCMVRPDGTDVRALPDTANGPFSWSPDSQWLVGPTFGKWTITMTRVDGSESRQVGGPAHNSRPAFMPDGTHVVYARYNARSVENTGGAVCLFPPPCDEPTGLWVAALDGSRDERISTGGPLDMDYNPVVPRP
jgi:Tol biopolymer transport system component